jgi:LacI family transcriptional regulator
MRDVAALAGVSLKTVSRVINGEPNVSPDTATRVQLAAKRLRYYPDVVAANLARSDRQSRSIALLTSSVDNPFCSAVFRGVEEVARERQVVVFTASTEESPQTEEALLTAFASRSVDGIILTPTSQDHRAIFDRIDASIPVVCVDRYAPGLQCDVVTANNREAARAATEHLLSHGHKRVAIITDFSTISTARDRLQGYTDAMAAAGLPIEKDYVAQDVNSEADGMAALCALMALPVPPTAIFASQLLLMVGALRGLRQLGLAHEVAIIGIDDVRAGDMIDPPLSVMAQNPVAIGRMAAERLFARLDGDDSPTQDIVVEVAPIFRGSGEIPAPANHGE